MQIQVKVKVTFIDGRIKEDFMQVEYMDLSISRATIASGVLVQVVSNGGVIEPIEDGLRYSAVQTVDVTFPAITLGSSLSMPTLRLQ